MIDATRYPRLSRIDRPADLRAFEPSELRAIADELRAYLIESVGKSRRPLRRRPGRGRTDHRALHYLYDTPDDRIVWDVGHQTYPHKILTGRRDTIHTVKQKDGVAPFPKREESEYDTFGVGHSSTSISAALGMAIANARAGNDRKVVAVIGDGAMTAGMAYRGAQPRRRHGRGTQPAGDPQRQPHVDQRGGRRPDQDARRMTGSKTSTRCARAARSCSATSAAAAPRASCGAGKNTGRACSCPPPCSRKWASTTPARSTATTSTRCTTLKTLKGLKGPQLLHVITTKGKGYELAEGDQIGYHAVSPVRPREGPGGEDRREEADLHRRVRRLAVRHGRRRRHAAGITPAMREGSGLVRFSQEYPQRYFDVAIAEQHAVTLAAGMACEGAKPVVAIYSTFLQRAYDQLVHDVAIQKLDVLFAIDRGGVVGPDGATHAGNLDLSFLRCVPNMVVMAPADENECRQMLSTGLHEGPAAVRYPRGTGPGVALDARSTPCRSARRSSPQRQRASPCSPSAHWCRQRKGRRGARPDRGQHALRQAAGPRADPRTGELPRRLRHPGGQRGRRRRRQRRGRTAGNAEGIVLPILHLGLPDAFQHHASREDLLAEAGLDVAGIRDRRGSRLSHSSGASTM
jgi:1-deoxy-D-xylulose-5-phosphate synthase